MFVFLPAIIAIVADFRCEIYKGMLLTWLYPMFVTESNRCTAIHITIDIIMLVVFPFFSWLAHVPLLSDFVIRLLIYHLQQPTTTTTVLQLLFPGESQMI